MRRSTTLLVGAAVSALAFSGLAVPAAAAEPGIVEPPDAVVVNGLPGMRVDVCIDGEEVKSRLRYGRSYIVDVEIGGPHKLVLKKARAGMCKGPKIGKLEVDLLGSDLTIVAKLVKGSPGLKSYFNGIPPGVVVPISNFPSEIVHHGAKAKRVDIYRSTQIVPVASPPRAVRGLRPGKSAAMFTTGNGASQMWLTKIDRKKKIAGPTYRVLEMRHNVTVFVGTKPGNYKLVKFLTGR